MALAVLALATLFSCGEQPGQIVTSDKGNYAITKLTGWEHEIINRSVKITQGKEYDSVEVIAMIIVAPGGSELPLDELFNSTVTDLKESLTDFQEINEGYTEIDGRPARWIKLSHTMFGYKYISVRYYLFISEKIPVMIECTSIDGTFEDFEEDFTKMVFTFKVLQ